MDDIQRLDERAVRASIAVVDQVAAADLARPTPCGGWTVAELLAHMAVQHDGFAAASSGAVTDLAIWEPRPLSDPVNDYAAAAERVIAAFADPGAPARRFTLPEISTEISFAGQTAMSFHFVDYVVHAWDVARSIGAPFEPDTDVLEAAMLVAEAVPDGPSRLEPGAAFAPSVPTTDDAPLLDRVLASLGRDPAWTPPAG
jgi:uncharacterized protein (TIGR03086 family)